MVHPVTEWKIRMKMKKGRDEIEEMEKGRRGGQMMRGTPDRI
jgi:hypothetical protein